jgi:predicted RNase H-like HicB family nuclease
MKLNYEMVLWWSAEDKACVVDVPELPGCMAHGATRQAAISNAEDAIKFWIKTAKRRQLGKMPRSLSRLKKWRLVALSQSSWTMSRKRTFKAFAIRKSTSTVGTLYPRSICPM